MMGIAIWHFAMFVPDRFKGGIVGAFGCAAVGAVIVGVALAGGEIDEHRASPPLFRRSPARSSDSAACWFWGDRTDERYRTPRARLARPSGPVPSFGRVTGRPEARWRAEPYPYERAVALASELGVSHTTAAVLVRRGFADGPAARSFLEGAEQHDPDLFAGIDDAVAVVMRHVAAGTPIAIHGDYDVDGVCSAAVLASALEALGARVHVRLPSRDEGYGLSVARVEELHARGRAAADHDGLRHHRLRRGRRARASWGWTWW